LWTAAWRKSEPVSHEQRNSRSSNTAPSNASSKKLGGKVAFVTGACLMMDGGFSAEAATSCVVLPLAIGLAVVYKF
jgi:hypothetical protein